ncbi:alkyl sulfatase [Vibrio astriarenae]|nr:alkyl sulfatase [Vibrio sp. C7]
MYVEVAGADKLFEAGTDYFNNGQYQEAAELFNNLVTCEPTNVKYREVLADTFEQQGYQSETMAWRNSYLQARLSYVLALSALEQRRLLLMSLQIHQRLTSWI